MGGNEDRATVEGLDELSRLRTENERLRPVVAMTIDLTAENARLREALDVLVTAIKDGDDPSERSRDCNGRIVNTAPLEFAEAALATSAPAEGEPLDESGARMGVAITRKGEGEV